MDGRHAGKAQLCLRLVPPLGRRLPHRRLKIGSARLPALGNFFELRRQYVRRIWPAP